MSTIIWARINSVSSSKLQNFNKIWQFLSKTLVNRRWDGVQVLRETPWEATVVRSNDAVTQATKQLSLGHSWEQEGLTTTVFTSGSGSTETTEENAGLPKVHVGSWRLKLFYLDINLKRDPSILENLGRFGLHTCRYGSLYLYRKKFGRI